MSLTHASPDEGVLKSLDASLRDLVRRDGVDPQREVALVRRLATQVVQDHDQRSLTGAVLPLTDHDDLVDELVANVAGFGPLQRYLDDPEVEEFRLYPRPSQGVLSAPERTLMPMCGCWCGSTGGVPNRAGFLVFANVETESVVHLRGEGSMDGDGFQTERWD